MTDEIRSVGPVEGRDRRAADRRAAERRAASASRALVPVAFPAEDAEPPARPAPTPPSDGSAAIFAAQVIGQTGQRRGLKGGPPVLDAARSAYLGAEYSGAGERRPKPGRTEDTDI
ncbi:hypothetical protein [Brevundimonas sp.]|jgi:hypothetical protein|uniref:hypothetical protein n=1 Tax=Brevundimonas sp. TaxID=1871086 RepID=UPI0025C0CF2C|nr:hypothetical protein [Brevundimonas sp.]